MANIENDDLRALSIVASGSEKPEVNEAIKTKLGIDDNDVKAWQMAQSESPEIRSAVENKISTKITDTREQIMTPGGLKASIYGGAQGASFGFSDEIVAGVKSAYEKVSRGGDFSKIYDKKVKKERDELKKLEEKYPLQFIAGELTGAFLVPIPGATALRGAKIGTKAVGKGAQLLAESALFSAGKSERDLLSAGFLKDVGEGTALGVGSGALLGKAGKSGR